MNDDKAFLDTNLFIYLYSDTDLIKKERVVQVANKFERFISTQVLNEFCCVCLRKLKLPVDLIRNAVNEITSTCNLHIVDNKTVVMALMIHEKYGYAYYDSLILASAVESGCQFLLTEDMADGQVITGGLTIRNVLG